MPTIREIRTAHIMAAAAGQVTDPAGLLCAWEWLQAEIRQRGAALEIVEGIDRQAANVPLVALQVHHACVWRDQITEQLQTHAPGLWSQVKGAAHV